MTVPGAPDRVVALPAGRGATLVARVALRPHLTEGQLSVSERGRMAAHVDTQTMHVRRPGIFGAFTVHRHEAEHA